MSFCKRIAILFTALCAAAAGLPICTYADENENLVAGLPYTVETGVGIAYSYGLSGNETDPAEGKLTDGKTASSLSYDDEAWHRFYRGTTRSVTFELPQEKAVTGFSVSLIQNAAAGLPMPPSFKLYVSEDGKDFMHCASYDTRSLQGVTEKTRREVNAGQLGRFSAKYVRISFRCEVSVYIDEIKVFGTDINGTEKEFVSDKPQEYIGKYDAGIEGCRDMVLLYCGYKGSYTDDYVNNTEEKLLPYFAYVSESGEIKDTFFDSVMFTALVGASPSGGGMNQDTKGQTVKSDWEYFIDSLFDEEYNCGAIERILERVKAETGKDDVTVSLVINIPYPHTGPKAFGDIDGDGEDEYCLGADDQRAIYSWFFDAVKKKMDERGYKNIRFGGYYWGAEGIQLEDEAESDAFIRSIADMVHSRGTNFFWIPYLYANGFTRTRELGFDCAMMQPNFSFLDYSDERCFDEIDEAIRKYGLGIEIEVKWGAISDDKQLSRYYTYLNAGYALGYMHEAAHSYYQNAAPGTFYLFSQSKSEKLRNAYDDTYAFVKRTYTPRRVILETRTRTPDSDGRIRGAVWVAEGEKTALGECEFEITEQPKYGKLDINSDGLYTYQPDGKAVKDSFTVRLKAEYAASEPLTVILNADADEPSQDTSPDAASDTTSDISGEKGLPAVPIAAAAAVLLAAAAAVWMIIKNKKRGKQKK